MERGANEHSNLSINISLQKQGEPMKPSHAKVANRFLNKTARSLLRETDEGFQYLGKSTYNVRDIHRLWDSGQPFHFIEEMPNGSMEEQELIIQAFPKKKMVEIHIKGITDSDESDGNFTTHHGQTHYMNTEMSSSEELFKVIVTDQPKVLLRKGMKSIYWQVIENDGGWQ